MSEASIVEPDITWLLVKLTLSVYAESTVSGRKRRGNGILDNPLILRIDGGGTNGCVVKSNQNC